MQSGAAAEIVYDATELRRGIGYVIQQVGLFAPFTRASVPRNERG